MMRLDRHQIARLASIGVLGIMLADCGGTPPPPAAAAAPSRPVPIDGAYGGLLTLKRGDAIACGNQDEFTLQVADRSFTYRLAQQSVDWRPVIVFAGTIAANGTFNVETGPDFMRGSVTGGHMQGEIAGDLCGFKINADRGGTW